MSFLRRLFGPSSRERAWRRAAELVGARYEGGGRLAPDVVQLHIGHAIATLDTQHGGDDGTTHTRIRAPYVNPGGFRFEIYRRTLFSRLGAALGMQDIIVGDAPFDHDFIIKSTSEGRIRELLAHERIRGLMRIQPQIHIGVRAGGSFLRKFPDRVDVLEYRAPVVITEVERLVRLFELFQEMLPKLIEDRRPGDDDVTRQIRRLRGPGGTILERGRILWSGNEALYEAAEALGELGDARAVGALASVMNKVDLALTVRAVEALGRIGNKRAVRPLLPLMGQEGTLDGKPLRVCVADALDAMGEGSLARDVLAALDGDPEGIRDSMGPYRPQVLQAFLLAITGPDFRHATRALAHVDAVEVLPQLRGLLPAGAPQGMLAESIAAAVRELEARSALPRPAEMPESASDVLPRPAGAPEPGEGRLPRPSVGEGDES